MIGDILHRSHEHDYIKPADFVTIFEPFLGKHNLVLSEGAEHDRARKMIHPAFYFNNLKVMISIMVEQTNKGIDEFLSSFNNQQTVDLQKEFNTLTLSIMVSSAFVAAAIEYQTMRMINQVPLLAKLPICQKHIIDQIIADRREGRSAKHALTFIFAGHETTSSLMIWISYILMTNNNVLRACQEEVDRIFSNGTQITYEHLTELNLLIPVDTTIIIDIYQLHRRAEFWHRPLEFDYTRWLRDPITGLKPKLSHPFSYLPFGAGPRNCIGQNFAMLEAKVILASLIQRCNFELEPGQKIIPDIMVNMQSKYGLRAKISRR
ncbi:unnamed protein product [Rotaria sordida]|uniref:Cytochrome P450 n=1 Tax=Rotaria sordida TaxID=392033 RepID=A0A820BDJ2_9BILA|nr:unnamed protein product [Rotaria sordida]